MRGQLHGHRPTGTSGCSTCPAAFSRLAPGLQRTDTLWKALGKAAILHTEFPRQGATPCRLRPPHHRRPGPGIGRSQGLKAAQTNGLIWDVLRLDQPETVAELLHYASGKRSEVEHRRTTPTAYA